MCHLAALTFLSPSYLSPRSYKTSPLGNFESDSQLLLPSSNYKNSILRLDEGNHHRPIVYFQTPHRHCVFHAPPILTTSTAFHYPRLSSSHCSSHIVRCCFGIHTYLQACTFHRYIVDILKLVKVQLNVDLTIEFIVMISACACT